MLARAVEEIAARAARLRQPVADLLGTAFAVEIAECRSQVGSGASPTATLPSVALVVRAPDGPEVFAATLRALPEPVIARIAEGAVWFDLRCLRREDEPAFLANLACLTP
jgi:L-seryl-tRNA(Ser) seleniumtransferase